MRTLQKVILIVLTITLIAFVVGCRQNSSISKETPETDVKPVALTVSAAASLKDALEEIKAAYHKEYPNVIITYNFGSSGSLQQQIEQGAEVDVFLSAAVKQMDTLKDKGLILEDTRKNFLENKLVLVVPKGSTGVSDLKDLATDKVKKVALGEPKSVPVGQYAEEMLAKLDILNSTKSKVVYGKDVKEVLTWVETGNLDAGIVYETDARASDKITIVAKAPEGSTSPIYYPAAVIKSSKNISAGKDFTNYLYSSKAKPIFEKYGFAFIVR